MTELLKELKGGASNFTMIGEVVLGKESFSGEIIKEGKTWCHTDSSFGVTYGDGLQSFVKLYGGYKIDKPVINAFSKDNEMVKINWEDRFNEELWEDLQPRSFYTAKIEKDDEGKLINKRFLNALDFADYLAEHLENGASVMVTGDIEYRVFGENNRLAKTYNLKAVYLNEEYKRNDEIVPKKPSMALARQTFLLDSDSLTKDNLKELKKEGTTAVQAFVPQYMSTKKVGENYVEYKKTDPIAVPIVFKAKGEVDSDEFNESIERTKLIWEQFFKVKSGKVREIGLYTEILEGYDKSKGEVEIDSKMQMLIDMGVLSEEDVKSQMTFNGAKASEFIYVKPIIRNTDDGMKLQIDDDKYAPEALIVAEFDNDDDFGTGAGADLFNDSDSKEDKEDKSKMSDQSFDDLFAGV